jgi:integrative and conjugative element protein (TIGR02256 family)
LSAIEILIPDTGFLLIESKVIKSIFEYRQIGIKDAEAGGILVGEYRSPHIRISEMTAPQVDDVRTRTGFHRKSRFHDQFAKACWDNTQGCQTWLGEWHTHPEAYPHPSTIDVTNWVKYLPSRPMILLIQGYESCWVGYWSMEKIVALGSV